MKKLYLTDVEAELLTEALESAWSVLEDKVNGSSNSAFRKYWKEKQLDYEDLQRQIERLEDCTYPIEDDECPDGLYAPISDKEAEDFAEMMLSEDAIQEVVDEINGQEVKLSDIFNEQPKFPEIRRTEGENWNV